MDEAQIRKAEEFLKLHTGEGCFLMPNAWDVGSAKMLVASGFKAIGTTSAGIAFSLGRPDNVFCSPEARVSRQAMLAEIRSIAEAVERLNLYREAGADCLFAPGASDLPTVSEMVREVNGPINVVMGLSGSDVSVAQLRDTGVRRISIGGSLARAVYFQIRQAAQEMLQQGTFTYARKQIAQSELNGIFESAL